MSVHCPYHALYCIIMFHSNILGMSISTMLVFSRNVVHFIGFFKTVFLNASPAYHYLPPE